MRLFRMIKTPSSGSGLIFDQTIIPFSILASTSVFQGACSLKLNIPLYPHKVKFSIYTCRLPVYVELKPMMFPSGLQRQ